MKRAFLHLFGCLSALASIAGLWGLLGRLGLPEWLMAISSIMVAAGLAGTLWYALTLFDQDS